jgi:hypothetical protein
MSLGAVLLGLDSQNPVVDRGENVVVERHLPGHLPAATPLNPVPSRRERYSRRAMRRVLLLVALALLIAGCGDAEPSVYKAEPTANCLSKDGYRVTINPSEIGVVAANAPNGGLRAFKPGNALTIAFGENSDDALGIERAFRRFAPKKLRPHIGDVMRTQKNAVLLWTVTPPQEEMNDVFACLKG